MKPLKTDETLGQEIHKFLIEKGVETPITKISTNENSVKCSISQHFKRIMEELGLDLTDDSLKGTPDRIGKLFVDELCYGLNYKNFPKITTIENKMYQQSDLLIEKVESKSMCEHHFVYFGTAHSEKLGCWVAYIPDKKIIGLSKINRIVDFFSRRPQVQERLVSQILWALVYILETDNVAVVYKGQHFCVLSRGIEDNTGYTVTSAMHGSFLRDPDLRRELLSFVNKD